MLDWAFWVGRIKLLQVTCRLSERINTIKIIIGLMPKSKDFDYGKNKGGFLVASLNTKCLSNNTLAIQNVLKGWTCIPVQSSQLMSLVDNEGAISFTTLLTEFKIPVVHYDIDSNCPTNCEQTEDCSIIRGAHRIAHKVVERIKSMDQIFKFLQKPILVGSLKENSRVFFLGKSHYSNLHIFFCQI